EWMLLRVARNEVRQRPARGAEERPDDEEHHARAQEGVSERTLPGLRPARRERRGGDQGQAEEAADDAAPGLRRLQRSAAEGRADREGECRDALEQESGREQEVEPPALDREADGSE